MSQQTKKKEKRKEKTKKKKKTESFAVYWLFSSTLKFIHETVSKAPLLYQKGQLHCHCFSNMLFIEQILFTSPF